MMLSIDYLNERHAFWKTCISQEGIWEENGFQPVTIVIRPDCKSYNGMFIRRMKVKSGIREINDRIFIYNKVNDFDTKFLDSLLVHEMIHQYIVQTGIKDSSTHGRIFKDFMKKINSRFPEELEIRVSDRNPKLPQKGTGIKTHSLLLLSFQEGFQYLCVINPSKLAYFEKKLKNRKNFPQLKSYSIAESNDIYFNHFSRCTRSLHGLKKNKEEMERFCSEHNVKVISSKTFRRLPFFGRMR